MTADRVVTTALAAAAIERLGGAFAAAADPGRAPAMAAYMRDQFDFFGIPAPRQRRLAATALGDLPPPDEADVVAFTAACWAAPQREYQYAGCDYAIRHVRRCSDRFLGHTRTLLTTKSWWDTVDALAAGVVGPLVRANPPLVAVMDEWIDDRDHWLVRTAILHQLHAKGRTDPARLFGYCTARAGDREFFVRKAIGWALREYSKTDAAAVREFVVTHPELSPLSAREALKWLQRKERGVNRPRVEIGIDCLDPFALAPFWEAALGYGRAEGDGHPYLNLVSTDGDGPTVFLQRVAERKGPKNRVHIDLYTRAPELLMERLLGLGATLLGEPVGPSEHWSFVVLADPEGNELCVCREVDDDAG